jgi:transposase-like protein
MTHKAKISGADRIAAIEKYLRGEDSLNHIGAMLGVRFKSIQQWLQTYQSLGPNGLLNTSKNITYSRELKNASSANVIVDHFKYQYA